MRRSLSLLASIAVLASGSARAETHAEAEEENHYAEQGQFEVGGSVSGSWTSELFSIGMSPSLGYFISDGFELSLIGDLNYQNLAASGGGREAALRFSLLAEPSYHFVISKLLALFGGLGVGVAYSGDRAAFDLEPRIGVNINVGRSGVFTPEISVPILFGARADPSAANVTAGLVFGAGFTTTF